MNGEIDYLFKPVQTDFFHKHIRSITVNFQEDPKDYIGWTDKDLKDELKDLLSKYGFELELVTFS